MIEAGVDAVLRGIVSDPDGDALAITWQEGATVLASGTIAAPADGSPIALPPLSLATGHDAGALGLGAHTLTLSVDDGHHPAVSTSVVVEVDDTTAPLLVPTSDCSLQLWPPNHRMRDIVVQANASDSSGGPVMLSASIGSSEAPGAAPDWTVPQIDQATGRISFQLRAERSGNEPGRIYSIAVAATDEAGHVSNATVSCAVPHDRRK